MSVALLESYLLKVSCYLVRFQASQQLAGDKEVNCYLVEFQALQQLAGTMANSNREKEFYLVICNNQTVIWSGPGCTINLFENIELNWYLVGSRFYSNSLGGVSCYLVRFQASQQTSEGKLLSGRIQASQ